MLKTKRNYPIDMCNVVWNLFEGKDMFNGNDPNGKGYSTLTHSAEVVRVLGPPPLSLLKRGIQSHKFFTKDGMPCSVNYTDPNMYICGLRDYQIGGKVRLRYQKISLESSEDFLSGQHNEMFLEFTRGMLQ
ncbi:hypothetical protein N7510_010504 [Penicillium lagena]|uniref:uncharacterized protein n=1 Tax=Penicillium lagena TaxID=94218 RepID=UPI00253F868A|nr:uncharacterized protein N7510_010504 [Penicillium lagena]KAJ5605350.1 hypothetical protein N7510_010504 [Penicillium lagena]